jgi:hypothetical protein
MFNIEQLRELIIKPALEDLIMLSDDAVELLVFTCAVESNGGSSITNAKGLGIYGMCPESYHDIWQNYLIGKSSLYMRLHSNFDVNRIPDEYRLIYDLRFATAMTRIHYARVLEPIPQKANQEQFWEYYKTHYNTVLGRVDKDQSLCRYHSFTNN